jgi:type II secretory pathway component GspD/PulD (secretin)
MRTMTMSGYAAFRRRLGGAVLVLLVGCLVTCRGQEGGANGGPKRLSDFDLPGLSRTASFESKDPLQVVQIIEALAHLGDIKNIVVGKDVAGQMPKFRIDEVPVGDALEVVLSVNQLAYEVTGGILTIMSDAEYSQKYGTSFYDEKQVKIVDLQYADATGVLALLEPVKSTIGTVVADAKTGTLVIIDTPGKIKEMEAVIAKADLATISRIMPTVTRSFPLQYAEVGDIESKLKPLLTEEAGVIHADERLETIIVTDLPHVLDQVADLIQVFDQRPKQVFIESKIVQVSLGDDYKLGIDWEHLMEGLEPRYSLNSSVKPPLGSASSLITSGAGIGSMTYQTVLGGGDLKVILDAVETVGDTKIRQNPHVAVLNGQEAQIKVITERPYAEAKLEGGTTNVVGESIKFIEVGVALSVTPRINDEGMISMAIKPEVSSVVGDYQAYRSVPIVRKSYAETKVMVEDGQTIIIAGMIENTTEENERRVPFFGRIPLLGYLFKSTSETVVSEETMVFLTPRIITGREPVMLLDDMKKQPKPLRTMALEGKRVKPARLDVE